MIQLIWKSKKELLNENMFIPAHFKMHNTAEIRNFIKVNTFGMLFINSSEFSKVTQLPIQLQTDATGNDSININFSKANPHVQALKNGESTVEVLF